MTLTRAADERSEESITMSDGLEKVKAFVEGYQAALLNLIGQLPVDGFILPRAIVSTFGRCEIWPCTDAAVVLTYPATNSDTNVGVREPTNQALAQFLKQSDVFSYFDETGERGPMRLSFAFPEKNPADSRPVANDFLFERFSLDDLICWPPETKSEDLGLDQRFFAPRFSRISVFGWSAHLGSPAGQALKDLRKAYGLTNLPCTEKGEKAGSSELIFQAALLRITELEALVNRNDSNSVRQFVIEHPDIIRPDYLRAYVTVSVNDQFVDLILLVPGEQAPELLLVKLGDLYGAFFTESNAPSEIYSLVQAEISSLEECLKANPLRISSDTFDVSKASFLYVMGRSATLSYSQKKSLYAQRAVRNHQFDTYDDLVNRFRFYVTDITDIRDRFLPVETRLHSINIKSDEDFDRLMQEIDREMQNETIPLPARSIEAYLRFSSVYSLYLLNRDPLCNKLNDWFARWYGDRAKIAMGVGTMGVILRGDVLRMEFPIGYGLNRIMCSRELTKDRQPVIIGTRENPPTLNPLDFVLDLTQEYANTLTDDELEALFNQFVFGRTAFMRIFEVFERGELTRQGRADLLTSSNHLFDSPPNYGLSKWASLQAAEKFIKGFIATKGGTAPRSHNLKQLATIAESHGLPKIPEYWLEDIECSAEVRYGGICVTSQEAIEAQYAALQVCEHVAIQ